MCPKCQQTVDSDEPFCPRDGTRLLTRSVYEQISSQTDPLVGTRVAGRYLVIKKLGEGGMGDVFLAEHEEIEKRLALKVLKQEYASRPETVVRFKQEAISASRIKHPNVLDVFDFGQLEDGRFYLAMELLEGRDLADVLASERVLEPVRCVRLGLQICRALAAAHARGVVHRDMKPENVFLVHTLDGEELVKIVDFGIAQLRGLGEGASGISQRKLTKTGMVFGTPEYMAPEQAAGKQIDQAIDVYSVGILLYEMLAGRVPFYGDTFMAVLTAHITQPVPPLREVSPSVRASVELERAILKALEKDPRARHASMAAFADALIATPEASTEAPLPLVRPAAEPPVVETQAQAGARVERAQRAAEGSAATQLALEAPAKSPGRRPLWVGLGVGLVAFGATAAVFAVRSRPVDRREAAPVPTGVSSRVEPSAVPGASVLPAVSAQASRAPSLVVGGPLEPVVIHVTTNPPGAVLKKKEGESLLQVCAVTPCDYPAQPDERLEFVAEKGALRGTGGVLARTAQTLDIALKPTAGAAPHGGATRTNNCEFCVPKGDPDCIKVIRPCDKPP
jgi:serine/threonine-protein kinase